jgi:YHS domain-containing protein
MSHFPGLRAFQSQPPASGGDPHAGHTKPGHEAEMQMDPVSGSMVDPATALKTIYQGKTYYFSSEQSRKEFLTNPAKYAEKDE